MASQVIDSCQITDRERRIKEIAQAMLRLGRDERTAYLDDACTDEAMRRDVEAVAAGILAEAKTLSTPEVKQRPPHDDSTIGPYQILELISQGGMGAVYLAERNDAEFKQRVAIKLIKRGMDTEFVMSRFRDERQILAALNHPSIARLLDGGTTSDGRPYFVMEYIKGKPITEYADEQRLSTVERLSLFKEVCAAVHYAHQNLVIHRDIKPLNILVTDDGALKLLDFGIAKLLNPEIAGHSLEVTAVGIRLMTPEYASPEQVKGEPVTMASDIYSLGVLLYELLTGHQPYRLSNGTQEEIVRIVCEEEPQKPSVAVGRVEIYAPGDGGSAVLLTPEGVSHTREGTPEKLRRRLTGDLDNIVLMALRKEPARRYASVDQFASDIDRHMEGRPVIARKDTLAYRASKFIKRHKAGGIAALLILISLIVGTVATLQQRAQAEQQRTQAEQQRARAENRSQEVLQLVSSFLSLQNSLKDLPGSTPMREQAAKRALESLDKLAREASGDQQLQRELATAYQQVGDVQGNPYENNIGDRQGALDSYLKVLAIREELVKQRSSNVEDRRGLAVINLRIGQLSFGMGHTQKAVEACQKGIGIAEELHENDQLDLLTSRELPNGYRTVAYALTRRGNPRAAFDSVRKGELLFKKLADAHPDDPQVRYDLLAIRSTVADARVELGDYAGALKTFHALLLIDEKLAAANPNNMLYKTALATDHMKIGNTELSAGNARSAAKSFRKMLDIMGQAAAADRTNVRAQNLVAIAQVRLGRALVKLDQFEEGLKYLQLAAVFFKQTASRNPSSPYAQIQMAYTDMQVSVALAKLGEGAQALELGNTARKVAEQFTVADPANVEFRGIQAGVYMMSGDVHATLAASDQQVSKKADHWRVARDWYQRSYDILKKLKDEGQSTDLEYGTPDELAAKVAQCEAALAGHTYRR
jgi:serine/threonine protein kinase